MAERIAYVVVCKCTGSAEPVALIDDGRPVGGPLTIRGPGPDDTLRQIAVADGERHSDLYRKATTSWANYTVIETEWGDGHSTWIIRCRDCEKQARLRDEKMLSVADHLAAAREKLPAAVDMPTRHEIPLGVLIGSMSR
jgi:hypothetical protein